MQVLTLTNGDTKLFIVPEDDYEKSLLARLLSAECTVENVPDPSRLYDKAINNAIVIQSKIDKNGNVFATGPGGVWIFNKNLKLIGKIKMDGVTVSNCALTPDNKTIPHLHLSARCAGSPGGISVRLPQRRTNCIRLPGKNTL